MRSRDHLARTQIDVHMFMVILILFRRRGTLESAADIDGKLRNVECPVLSGDLGIGLDAVAVGLVDGIGVVLASLDGVGLELLRDLGHDLVIVGGRRLIVVDVG